MDKFFKLRENKTTVRTEILAGLTTFLSMAYVLFVNPSMLATTGMELKAVFVATILASVVGSLAMGLIANYPIGLAPGMGLNAFFRLYRLCAVGNSLANGAGWCSRFWLSVHLFDHFWTS